MAFSSKVWWLIGGIAAAIGLPKLVRASTIPAKMLVELAYGWEGLSLVVNTTIKNPVGQSVQIKSPFVKVAYQGNVLGSNTPTDQMITIPANGSVRFPVKIGFNLVSMALSVPTLYKAIIGKQRVGLDITVESGLQTALGIQEFSKTDTFQTTIPTGL